MNSKIIKLSVVVVFLAAAAFFLESRSKPRSSDLFYPNLNGISKIEIEYFTRGTRLEKDADGIWWASDFRNAEFKRIDAMVKDPLRINEEAKGKVDPAKIDQLLSMITEMKKGKPVAANPEKFRELKLEDSALAMVIYDAEGKQVSRLLIGNQGPQLITTFVRESNSNEVYLVDQYLPGLLSQSTEEWQQP